MPAEVARVCRHVANGAPILFAARERLDRAEWEFRCGAEGETDAERRLVPLDEVVRMDPTAVEIVMHPAGTALRRSATSGRWRIETGPMLFPHRPSRRWPRFDPRYPPRRGEPLDASDLRLMADVSQRGWHVVEVPASAAGVAYAFSVGLFRTFDHPEVAIFGLSPDELREALARVGERVRGGDRFEDGGVADGIVAGRVVAFRRIVARHLAPLLGHAVWYHGGPRFPALQAVWADEAGRLPWDRWFAREHRDAQPVLFEPEPA